MQQTRWKKNDWQPRLKKEDDYPANHSMSKFLTKNEKISGGFLRKRKHGRHALKKGASYLKRDYRNIWIA